MAEGFANEAETTLTAGIDAVTQTVPLANAGPPLPPTPFRARIDNEFVIVTAGRLGTAGAGSVTVTRAAEGSTAATHASGSRFVHLITAGGLTQRIADDIAAIPTSAAGGTTGTPALRTIGTGSTQAAAGNRAVYKGQVWVPSFNNLKAANMDPAQAATTSTAALVQGTSYFAKLRAAEAFTVANIVFGVLTPQTGATYAHLGLFSGDGTTQLVDVDLLVSGHLASGGNKTVPVSSGSTGVTSGAAGALDLTLDQVVYVGILTVGATTAPSLNKAGNLNAGFVNTGLAATDGWRWGTAASQTTLAPVAIGSMTSSGLTHFFGLG